MKKALLIIIAFLLAVLLFHKYPEQAPMPVVETIYTVTAYCPCEECCGRFSDGITASGHIIQPGDKFVAAPPEIPYGTMLDIPGYGVVPVLDRGVEKGRLDVFFSTHQEALVWGVRQLNVKMGGAE